MSRIVLPLCLLALACSNSGKLSSVETVDDTDTTDGSDGADVTDGSDGTDEADASDGADGSDGDDTADSGDSGDTGSGEDPVVVLPDLTVDCEGSADFEEIQDAIEAADHGDIIAVLPCTYRERLDFLGKTLHVYGVDGPEVTILDGENTGTLVNVETGEGPGTRLAGFTLTGGYDEAAGSVIELLGSNLEIEDVIIRGNAKGMYIIQSLSGWLDITNAEITENDVQSEGLALLSDDGGSLTVDGMRLDCDNSTAGIYAHVALNLDRVDITCDEGYGIHNYHGELWMQRSTVSGGLAGIYSYDTESTAEKPDYPSERNYIYNSTIYGGLIGLDVRYMDVQLINSVFWGTDAALSMTANNTASFARNSVFLNAACGIVGDQPFTHRFSAFYNNGADGCGITVTPAVSADPRFVSFPEDLALRSDSPLVDAGDPAAGYDDVDGSVNDIGRHGGPWGD